MISKAKSKIQAEMEKEKNPYVQAVGAFLLQYLDSNPQDAEQLAAADKTIAKSLDEMRNVAAKKKVGNCAVLTDQEGFAVVLKYFGIEPSGVITAPVAPVSVQPAPTIPKPSSSSIDFDIKLDDLL